MRHGLQGGRHVYVCRCLIRLSSLWVSGRLISAQGFSILRVGYVPGHTLRASLLLLVSGICLED
jgi:hypothetical protein